MARRRTDRQPRPPRRPATGSTVEQVAELLEAELGERLGARVAANLADFDVLARRDAATVGRLSKELGEDAPVLVPYLDEDIQDLAGLARIAGHLLG